MAKESKVNCGCLTAIFIFNLLFGGWSVDYLTNQVFIKNLPFWADIVIGLFTAQLSVPAAIVV